MNIDMECKAVLDNKRVKLDAGKRDYGNCSTGLDEEGEGEGVSGEVRSAEGEHVLVDVEGFKW